MTDPINVNPLNPIQKYAARMKYLEQDRLSVISLMKDVSSYIMPRKGLYTADGEKPHEKVADKYKMILNSTATRGCRLLASGIQGGLTSPSRPWFRIRTQDPELYNIEEVAMWCQYVEDIMYSVFNGSNFYSAVHTVYEDEGGFGQGVLFEEEDPFTTIRFTVCPPGEYCLATNERGIVDTLYRRYWMPACNVVGKFGEDRVSDDVKNAYKNPGSYYKLFEIAHVIEPNGKRDATKIDSGNMPYRSAYYEFGKTEKFLSEGGFNELPFFAPRWAFQHPEVYGDCPSFDALGVTKMLQASEKISIKAMDKEVDPPMRIPTKWHGKRANLLPGGHNYVDSNDPKDAIGRLYDMRFDISQVEGKIERFEALIERLYYMDLFTLITDRPEMTATEVLERKEEKLTLLGPTIENQINELLEPVMIRTFNICQRKGMFPPPPPDLQGKLEVDYISLLAQAQKMIGIAGMEAYLEKAERIGNIEPNSLIKTDWDAFLEEYANRVALSPRITREQEMVDGIRAENAARQKELEDAEMMKGAAQDVKNLSQADTSGKNALTDIADAVSE